jgi:hypothetical protein
MRKLIIMALLIFGCGCAANTQYATDAAAARMICTPIYGRGDDWDKISDDLARNIYRHNRMCEKLSALSDDTD